MHRAKTKNHFLLTMLTCLMTGLLAMPVLAQQALSTAERVESAHRLMHHGLAMASEAADLVMISELGLGEGLGETSVDHAREALQRGRDLIESAADHADELDGEASEAMLDFTQSLETAYLNYVDVLEGMSAPAPSDETMPVHQMHMLLNHAVRMAADGANLNMIGSSDRDRRVAELGGEHGDMMLERARDIIEQVMSGDAMQAAHQAGLTGSPMQTAHQLGQAGRDIIQLMDRMPVSPN